MQNSVDAFGVAGEFLHLFAVAIGAQIQVAGIGEIGVDLLTAEAADML